MDERFVNGYVGNLLDQLLAAIKDRAILMAQLEIAQQDLKKERAEHAEQREVSRVQESTIGILTEEADRLRVTIDHFSAEVNSLKQQVFDLKIDRQERRAQIEATTLT